MGRVQKRIGEKKTELQTIIKMIFLNMGEIASYLNTHRNEKNLMMKIKDAYIIGVLKQVRGWVLVYMQNGWPQQGAKAITRVRQSVRHKCWLEVHMAVGACRSFLLSASIFLPWEIKRMGEEEFEI